MCTLFLDPNGRKAEQISIQVNGGKPGVKDVRDLRGVLERGKAAMRILISLQSPTRDMVAKTLNASFNQRRTIQELTHCATDSYIVLSAPIIHRLTAAGFVR
jgi:hypothetical protein